MVASPCWKVAWAGSISTVSEAISRGSRDTIPSTSVPVGSITTTVELGCFLSVWRTRLRASVDFPDWVLPRMATWFHSRGSATR